MQSSTPKPGTAWARAMLWSILYQDRLAHWLRIYVGLLVAFVVFMGMVGIITLDAALQIIFFGGVGLSSGLVFFIRKRRSWLLAIEDPSLKRLAHASMLAYLSLKGHPALHERPASKKPDSERECTIF